MDPRTPVRAHLRAPRRRSAALTATRGTSCLTLLGRLGVYELRPGKLFLSGENEATWAAKRALGIGDPLLLERRAGELAQASGVPIEALDLALHNWGSGTRLTGGLPEDAEGDAVLLEQAQSALGL